MTNDRIERAKKHFGELLEAQMERDRSDREDVREQAGEFRRRLDEREGRVQEIEGRLPPE